MHSRSRFFQLAVALCLTILIVASPQSLRAQSTASLADRIQKVMDRPEFAHANFGIEFYDIATGKVVYSLNANKLFVPASTTKTLTEGTVLAKLGADYRFHTVIYRTGPIDKKGTLKGRPRPRRERRPKSFQSHSARRYSLLCRRRPLLRRPSRHRRSTRGHQRTRQSRRRKRYSQNRRPRPRRRQSLS